MGIYSTCVACTGHICCTNQAGNQLIPWILPEEVGTIRSVVGGSCDFFEPPESGEVFGRLKRDASGDCLFLTPNGCSLGDAKPYDCKMFPYDVVRTKVGYYLIRYTHLCPRSEKWDSDLSSVTELALRCGRDYALKHERVAHPYVLIGALEQLN